MNPRSRFSNPLSRSRLLVGGASLLCLTVASQAALFKKGISSYETFFKSGNIAGAVSAVAEESKKNDTNRDAIMWKLEQGATLRAAAFAEPGVVPAIAEPTLPPQPGAAPVAPVIPSTPVDVTNAYLRHSLLAFDAAEEKVNAYDEKAKLSVTSEVGASLTNQSMIPYRGRSYDRVLMNAYKAIAYMQLGEIDKARVELNRSLQRQRDAVAQNEKRIAEAKETEEKAKSGEVKDENGKSAAYDADKGKSDPKTGPALNAVLEASTASLVMYGDYVNPFTVFLDALFFTVHGEGGSDLERGRKSMERVVLMVPSNPYAKEDLALFTAAAEGKAPEGVTYVLFETGTGPDRDETKIDIPTFLVSSKVAYVGAAFPKLIFNSNFVGALSVKAGEQTVATATLASMDSVVAHDFKNEWPVVVSKTLISTATKAIVLAQAQKGADKLGAFGSIAGKIGAAAFSAASTHADLRIWTSLPKEFQYARIATPADRQLTLAAGNESRTVTLVPGAINIVYVKSVSPSTALLVSQFALK